MQMKKVWMLVLGSLLSFTCYSQTTGYNTVAGIRLGSAPGITGKTAIGGRMAVEGLITTRWDGVILTGLAEVTSPIVKTQGLGWYIGGGAHVGFWDFPGSDTGTEFALGVDGILGMEYTFVDIPLNLSLDWKPMFNIVSETTFVWDDFALSVRYVFN
jgi:hypothetical protein